MGLLCARHLRGEKVRVNESDTSRAKSLFHFLFGRRLKTTEAESERVGPVQGVPIFGLDAIGSSSYGPEAALTVLLPLGAMEHDLTAECVALPSLRDEGIFLAPDGSDPAPVEPDVWKFDDLIPGNLQKLTRGMSSWLRKPCMCRKKRFLGKPSS